MSTPSNVRLSTPGPPRSPLVEHTPTVSLFAHNILSLYFPVTKVASCNWFENEVPSIMPQPVTFKNLPGDYKMSFLTINELMRSERITLLSELFEAQQITLLSELFEARQITLLSELFEARQIVVVKHQPAVFAKQITEGFTSGLRRTRSVCARPLVLLASC
ncbi:hypothetical protein BLOT_016778, partial [Blomia tropicalis]